MAKIVERITDTSAWVASSDLTAIDLPRDGLITQISIRMAITMGGALTSVQPDGVKRAIENLSIVGDSRTFLGLSGEQTGRLLAFLNMYQYRGAAFNSLPLGTVEQFTWMFHPGSVPSDPFDMSAVIPAQDLATLQSKLTTTGNDEVDDSVTISSGIYYYTIWKVTEIPMVNGKTPGLMVPDTSTNVIALDANLSNYSKEIDLPTGGFLRSVLIMVQDDTGTRPLRADDEVTAVRVRLPRTGKPF